MSSNVMRSSLEPTRVQYSLVLRIFATSRNVSDDSCVEKKE